MFILQANNFINLIWMMMLSWMFLFVLTGKIELTFFSNSNELKKLFTDHCYITWSFTQNSSKKSQNSWLTKRKIKICSITKKNNPWKPLYFISVKAESKPGIKSADYGSHSSGTASCCQSGHATSNDQNLNTHRHNINKYKCSL